ncbi:MAG TPA: YicC/YloC family endoribonuclease [Thermodesulfovibrionales bacterium]|nr:YicC/YloC family endoribonuclease [Thermodesulfovibrionales bacterium]
MTGFGASEKGSFRVEMRSLNHRFLEIAMKISPHLSEHEIPLRNLVKERFARGKFDVLVSLKDEENPKIRVHRGLAREIYTSLLSLKEELSLSGTIGIETIAGFRELIVSEEVPHDTELLYSAFAEAMDRVQDMRNKEGESIAQDMRSRLERVEHMNTQVSLLSPEVVNACKERFMERLRLLFGDAQYDENRVLQEAAIIAEKTDISEEITRIHSHVKQMRQILSAGDTIGRKLEFLLQELNREVNTISSKANNYRVSSSTVEIKAELEKMREQAQNIQ